MADLTPSTNGDLPPSENPNSGSPPSPHSPSNQNQSQSPYATSSQPAASRKSERKRKLREFPEMSSPSKVTAPHKTWSDADEVTLLRAAKEFRARTGSEPKIATIREFFDKIKGSVAPHLDPDKVYYKLKRLKSKFLLNGDIAPSGAHEKVLYNLSKDVWLGVVGDNKKKKKKTKKKNADAGNKDEVRDYEDEDDYAIVTVERAQKEVGSFPFLSEALREYWKSNGEKFSSVSLENGLMQLDNTRARELEKKWKKQLEADIRSRMKRHEIFKEVYALLIDGVKGQG
ncbi:DNA-binding storekeeper protein-related transcriptional regulator [Rhynchospora pubera]|uniref:DNA-binding storekeeper protein-related transcriptional regulator n=1 Tax=Rhynchospora pubera TaxID=906938 RepID=A0AAV8HF71_9POAL|nr:DNA-binding storekeeper protein-related transcriptional regulator [Rhynchospora pubera]